MGYNDMNNKMHDFAKELLSDSEFREADSLSWKIANGTKPMKMEARNRLMEKLEPPPHMLRDAQFQIQYLPTSRYNSIQALHGYIDNLVKAMAFEFTKNPDCKESSLSENIERMNPDENNTLSELIDNLRRYAALFYDSNQDRLYNFSPDREHHFTARETVYLVFLTLNLAKQITKISPFAKKVSLDKETIEDL
jgi:hypothetical protein